MIRADRRRLAVAVACLLVTSVVAIPVVAAGETTAPSLEDEVSGAPPPATATGSGASPNATASLNASGLHRRGTTGEGVRVAIVADGFDENGSAYADAVVATHETTTEGRYPERGDRMAEAVHRAAPDAELLLYQANALQRSRADAIEHATEQGNADVILVGAGGMLGGPRTGDSRLARAVDDAVARGVPVVTPTGDNGNGSLWRGRYRDPDDDGVHEFADGSERMRIDWDPNATHGVLFQWNDWSNPDADYRISVTNYSCWSCSPERPSDEPLRARSFFPTAGDLPTAEDVHYLRIRGGENATEGRRIAVEVTGRNARIAPWTRSGSVSLAATAERAIVVGAVDSATGRLAPYSGRGPTRSGARRPHVVAPTDVTVGSAGPPVDGTFVAAARTAGVAALVLDAEPGASPAAVGTALTGTARPVRGTEPNNATGHGLVDAGAAVASATEASARPPAVSGSARPRDPDDDGLYEDVNGNARQDIADAVVLFRHRDDPAVTDHAGAYDFTGGGGVSIGDAVALFRENAG